MPKVRIQLNTDGADERDLTEQADALLEDTDTRPRERSRPAPPAHKLERARAGKEFGRMIARTLRERGDKRKGQD